MSREGHDARRRELSKRVDHTCRTGHPRRSGDQALSMLSAHFAVAIVGIRDDFSSLPSLSSSSLQKRSLARGVSRPDLT